MARINYSIRKNRLERSYLTGMTIDEDSGCLFFDEETGIHRIFVDVIDSATEDQSWGRFSFSAELQENMALYVYAFASNFDSGYDNDGNVYALQDMLFSEEVSEEDKMRLFSGDNALRFVGKQDMLLYGIRGRFLYLAIEVLGAGEGSIDHLRVDVKGDQFMDAFPAVYREDNGFFHRFLSVFSSIYNDLDHEIERLPQLLDAEKCPRECLKVYAGWLGINLSGDFLSEEAERQFVREAYDLNRKKGTRGCISRVIEIVLGETPVILESNTVKSYLERGEMKESEAFAGGIYDVNILIRTPLSDTDKKQLYFLLNQFKPIRSRLHLIQLMETSILDDEVYLDMNAVIGGETVGVLDDNMVLTEEVILDE